MPHRMPICTFRAAARPLPPPPTATWALSVMTIWFVNTASGGLGALKSPEYSSNPWAMSFDRFSTPGALRRRTSSVPRALRSAM
jgi:hypothetical protein